MRPLLILLLSVPLGASAHAQSLESLAERGRYQLMEINDRIVRLDMQTGAFDVCGMEKGAWSCKLAYENRRELDETIAQLTARIERLEAALAETKAVKEGAREKEKGLFGKLGTYIPKMGW